MAALDYFFVSPGDKKRRELELQNQIRLEQKTADIERNKALQIRDSNQLSADFQKHKQEQDLREALANMYPENNPNLTADQNDTLALIHAGSKMDEIKAAQPLSNTANEMQNVEEKTAQQPYNAQLGATGATSAIESNLANAAQQGLNRSITKARASTAVPAATSADVAQTAINTYHGANANQQQDLLPYEKAADIAGAQERKALANYNTNYNLELQPTTAAGMMNEKNVMNKDIYNIIRQNPALSKIVQQPNITSAIVGQGMFPMLYGNGTNNFGGTNNDGAFNSPVGPKPLSKIQR